MRSKCIFLSTFFLICFFSQTNAQIKKYSIFLGGNVSFSSIKYKIDVPQDDPKKQKTIMIQPIIGKAIKENLVLGIYFGFAYLNSDNLGSTIATKSTSYAGAVFIRKYKPLGYGFSLFGQTDLYLLHETRIYERDIETEKIQGPGIGITIYPGLSYSVNKKLQLETGFNELFSIGFSRENRLVKSKDDRVIAQSTANFFSAATSLNNIVNFSLGFRLLISK